MPAVVVSANPLAHQDYYFRRSPGVEAYHHHHDGGVKGNQSQRPLHLHHDRCDDDADQGALPNPSSGSLATTMKPSSPITRFQAAFPESTSPRSPLAPRNEMPASASTDRWEGSSSYRAEQQSPREGSQEDALRLQMRPASTTMNAANASPSSSQSHLQPHSQPYLHAHASHSQSHLDKFPHSPRRPLAFGEQVAAKASWSRKASDLPTVTVPMGRVERNFSSAISSHRGHFPASSKHFLTVVPPEDFPCERPHPRSKAATSSYSHLRRGALLPLYPTLNGQLYAISREYGLPSIGGLAIYLCEDADGNLGPRIGEASWQALWARYFEEDDDAASGSQVQIQMQHRQPPSSPYPSGQYSVGGGEPLRSRSRPGLGRDMPEGAFPTDADGYSFGFRTPGHVRRPTGGSGSYRGSPVHFSSEHGSSFANGRSSRTSSALPIIGRVEWAVDRHRAPWWSNWIGEADASSVRSAGGDTGKQRKQRSLQLSKKLNGFTTSDFEHSDSSPLAHQKSLTVSSQSQDVSGSDEQISAMSSPRNSYTPNSVAESSLRRSMLSERLQNQASSSSLKHPVPLDRSAADPVPIEERSIRTESREPVDAYPSMPPAPSTAQPRHSAAFEGLQPPDSAALDANRKSMGAESHSYAGYSALLDDEEPEPQRPSSLIYRTVSSETTSHQDDRRATRQSGSARYTESRRDTFEMVPDSDESMWRALRDAPQPPVVRALQPSSHRGLSGTDADGTLTMERQTLKPSDAKDSVSAWINSTQCSPDLLRNRSDFIQEDIVDEPEAASTVQRNEEGDADEEELLPPQDDVRDVMELWAMKTVENSNEHLQAHGNSENVPSTGKLLSPIALDDMHTFQGSAPQLGGLSSSSKRRPAPLSVVDSNLTPNATPRGTTPLAAEEGDGTSLMPPKSPSGTSAKSGGTEVSGLEDFERALELLSPVASAHHPSPSLANLPGFAEGRRMTSRDSLAAAKTLSTSVSPSPRWLSKKRAPRSQGFERMERPFSTSAAGVSLRSRLPNGFARLPPDSSERLAGQLTSPRVRGNKSALRDPSPQWRSVSDESRHSRVTASEADTTTKDFSRQVAQDALNGSAKELRPRRSQDSSEPDSTQYSEAGGSVRDGSGGQRESRVEDKDFEGNSTIVPSQSGGTLAIESNVDAYLAPSSANDSVIIYDSPTAVSPVDRVGDEACEVDDRQEHTVPSEPHGEGAYDQVEGPAHHDSQPSLVAESAEVQQQLPALHRSSGSSVGDFANRTPNPQHEEQSTRDVGQAGPSPLYGRDLPLSASESPSNEGVVTSTQASAPNETLATPAQARKLTSAFSPDTVAEADDTVPASVARMIRGQSFSSSIAPSSAAQTPDLRSLGTTWELPEGSMPAHDEQHRTETPDTEHTSSGGHSADDPTTPSRKEQFGDAARGVTSAPETAAVAPSAQQAHGEPEHDFDDGDSDVWSQEGSRDADDSSRRGANTGSISGLSRFGDSGPETPTFYFEQQLVDSRPSSFRASQRLSRPPSGSAAKSGHISSPNGGMGGEAAVAGLGLAGPNNARPGASLPRSPLASAAKAEDGDSSDEHELDSEPEAHNQAQDGLGVSLGDEQPRESADAWGAARHGANLNSHPQRSSGRANPTDDVTEDLDAMLSSIDAFNHRSRPPSRTSTRSFAEQQRSITLPDLNHEGDLDADHDHDHDIEAMTQTTREAVRQALTGSEWVGHERLPSKTSSLLSRSSLTSTKSLSNMPPGMRSRTHSSSSSSSRRASASSLKLDVARRGSNSGSGSGTGDSASVRSPLSPYGRFRTLPPSPSIIPGNLKSATGEPMSPLASTFNVSSSISAGAIFPGQPTAAAVHPNPTRVMPLSVGGTQAQAQAQAQPKALLARPPAPVAPSTSPSASLPSLGAAANDLSNWA